MMTDTEKLAAIRDVLSIHRISTENSNAEFLYENLFREYTNYEIAEEYALLNSLISDVVSILEED